MVKILIQLILLAIGTPLHTMEKNEVALADIKSLFDGPATSEELERCTICQMPIFQTEAERTFSCNHSFHNKCTRDALDIAKTDYSNFSCPNCREPVMTFPPIPDPQSILVFWEELTKDPTAKLKQLDNKPFKELCALFANAYRNNRSLDPEILKENFILYNQGACALQGLVEIVGERSKLDTQLSDALEKLSIHEKNNPQLAKIISENIDLKKELAKVQEKLEKKKKKLNQTRVGCQTIFEETTIRLIENVRLRVGLSALSGIVIGACVRNLLGNEKSPANKSALASGLSVAIIGTGWSFYSSGKQFLKLQQLIRKQAQ